METLPMWPIKQHEITYDHNITNDLQSLQITVSPGSNPVTTFTSSTGINVDDGITGAIATPFTINLYDRSYNSFYISTNGLISFNSGITAYIPAPNSNNRFIAPFWDDIDLQYGGSVYYTMNSSQIIITWDHVPSYIQRSQPNFVQHLPA